MGRYSFRISEREETGSNTSNFSFWDHGFCETSSCTEVARQKGQRMVLGDYLGARYNTGGGCLVYPVSVDSTEEVIGHNF